MYGALQAQHRKDGIFLSSPKKQPYNFAHPDADPSAAGKASMLKRWGPPRHIHIGHLTPPQRELVFALVKAQEMANEVVKTTEGQFTTDAFIVGDEQ